MLNKKFLKILLSTLIITGSLGAYQTMVKATSGQVTRTSGVDRYATAAQVATQNWTTSDNIVLVNGDNYPDAVSASALAKKLDAPILLTSAGSLNTDAQAAITRLAPKNIYIVGGNASVSQSVRNSLKVNYSLTELGGVNRYETNVAVANELVKLGVDPSNVMLVGGEGFSDALSVAPVAAAKGEILLLGNNDSSSMKSVINFVKTNNSKVTVVGTSNVISDSTLAKLGDNSTRVDGGLDRFDTNLKILNAFKSDLKIDKLYVASASGDGFPDALVASSLAGKTDAPLVLVDSDDSVATNNAVDFIKNDISTTTDLNIIGGIGVVSDNTVKAINAAVNPQANNSGTATPGQVSVTSVTVNSATSFQVKFSSAINDTSKVSFNVTRGGGTPVPLTITWDPTNTIATLSYSSTLPIDTYVVAVKNDTTDLGSTSVEATTQKIGKIEITSTTLNVAPPTISGGMTVGGKGYATYRVLDQFGNDITTSSLTQGIAWTCGVGIVTANNGLLTVSPVNAANNFLTQHTTASINAIDQTTRVTASANLTVSQSLGVSGVLSNITLNKLYCRNNPSAVFTSGDTADSFYIDYTATDLSGNTTNNYNMIKLSLMADGTGNITGLISSNPAVTVSLVYDPYNDNNALIQVTCNKANSNITTVQTVVITVLTNNGKSSSISLTYR